MSISISEAARIFLLCKRAKLWSAILILSVVFPNPTIKAKDIALDQELLKAAQHGTAEQVAELLRRGANPNATDQSGRSALCEAVGNLDSRVLKVLLDAGAKPDDSAMWQAGWLKKTERVKLLLDTGGIPDACLAGAALGGHKELVRVLLEKGANVNASYRDVSPLYGAAGQGGLEVVQMLLAAGADPNATDPRGVSPLHRAMSGGRSGDDRLPMVKALVKAGAKLNVTNEEGITPVRDAAIKGHKEIYEWLLSINGGKEPRATADPHSLASEKSTSSLVRELVQDNYKNRLRAQRELVSRGSEIMPEVLKNIEAGVPIEKLVHLFEAMGTEADSALPKLSSLLSDKRCVLAVAFTLERMKPEGLRELSVIDRNRAAAALYEAVLDPEDRETDLGCSRILAMLGDEAEPYIYKMLDSGDPNQQGLAIGSLEYARFPQAKFQAELLKVARQGRSEVRAKAVWALGQFTEPNDEVKALLLEILKTPPPSIPNPNVVPTEYHSWRELDNAARAAKAKLGIK